MAAGFDRGAEETLPPGVPTAARAGRPPRHTCRAGDCRHTCGRNLLLRRLGGKHCRQRLRVGSFQSAGLRQMALSPTQVPAQSSIGASFRMKSAQPSSKCKPHSHAQQWRRCARQSGCLHAQGEIFSLVACQGGLRTNPCSLHRLACTTSSCWRNECGPLTATEMLNLALAVGIPQGHHKVVSAVRRRTSSLLGCQFLDRSRT